MINNGLPIPNRSELFSVLIRNLFNKDVITNLLNDSVFKNIKYDYTHIDKKKIIYIISLIQILLNYIIYMLILL